MFFLVPIKWFKWFRKNIVMEKKATVITVTGKAEIKTKAPQISKHTKKLLSKNVSCQPRPLRRHH